MCSEEIVQVSVLHVLKKHHVWIAVPRNAIKMDNVAVLKVGQKFCFPLKILSHIIFMAIFQRFRRN